MQSCSMLEFCTCKGITQTDDHFFALLNHAGNFLGIKITLAEIRISNEGYAGSALTFVNYNYELPFFCDRVLPLMKQAGLRVV